MRRFLASLLLPLALALSAQAQEATAPFPEDEDGGGFLTRTIERQLSGENQTVHLVGFEGLLSSRASFRRLTIADSEGVWLSIDGAELDWNRRALLRGEVQVNHLTAQRIELLRLPPGDGSGGFSLPSPTSTEVRLPDLPVGIDIGRIATEVLHLGPEVLGQPIEARLEGSARLAGGSGALVLAAERIDGRQGRLALDAAFDATTRNLRLQVALTEAAEGPLSGLLGLPGRPALEFSIAGEGPIGAFSADILLATDGQPRLEGRLGFHDLDAGAGLGFDLRLAGDLAPLFAEPLRPFFGSHTVLEVSGQSLTAGGMRLDRLHFASDKMQLDGSLELAADRMPRRFALEGRLAPAAGDTVRLPLPGPPTRLGAAQLSAQFDETAGEAFRADLTFADFSRDGLVAEEGKLSARGHLRRAEEPRRVTADLMLDLDGVAFGSAGLTEALGGRVFGSMVAEWTSGGGVEVRNADLTAGAGHLLGEAQFSGLGGNLRVTTRATVNAESLIPFSTLAGRPLAGAAHATLDGFYEPLGGAFDLRLDATTRALDLGEGLIGALAGGDGSVSGRIARDAKGTTFDGLKVATPAMSGQLAGTLGPETGALTLDVKLADFGLIHAGLPGPAAVTGTLGRTGPDLRLDLQGKLPTGIALTVAGTSATDFTRADVTIDATVPEVASLVPQLSGPVTAQGGVQLAAGVVRLDLDTTLGAAPDARVQLRGSYALDTRRADLDLRGTADLGLVTPFAGGALELAGQADLDLRLEGPLAAESLSGALTAQGVQVTLPQAGIAVPDATLAVTLLPAAERGGALLAAQVAADLPRIEAPGAAWVALLEGPVTLEGRVGLEAGGRLTVEALRLANGGAQLGGKVALTLADGGLDARLALDLPRLARLNPLLPVPLSGSATAEARITRAPGATALDVQLDAQASGLSLEQGTGIFALVDPEAQLSAGLRLDDGALSLSDLVLTNGGARVTGSARMAPPGAGGQAEASLTLHLASLARLRPVVDLPLAGALDLGAELRWDGSARRGEAQLSGRVSGLSLGPGTTRQLLAGDATLSGRLALAGGALSVEEARFTNAALDLRGSFTDGVLRFDARLDSLGRLIAAIPGPVTASGSIAPGVPGGVQVAIAGPAGITAQASGALSRGMVPDLRITAAAPLGIANLFLGNGVNVQGQLAADLSLTGSLGLAGLAGRVTVSGGAVAIPGVSTAMQGLTAEVTLGGGTAQIAAQTGFNTAGRAELAGTVGLSGAMPVTATARLLAVEFVQHPLLRTTLNGELRLSGAMQGASSLSGRIDLGETEISLNFGSGSGTLLDVAHINEPAASLATRQRAGLLEEPRESRRSGPPLSLDVTVSAPSRVFVRGRGLDAEMGGEIRLTGRAGAIIPIGGFELIRGRLNILTRRLELTEGSVRLLGDFDPVVRLVAATSADGVAASIVVEGSASRPSFSIVSVPPLPQEEVLALLLFGRHIQSISPIQALQLGNAVRTLLSGGDGAQGRVRRRLGLDDLDLTTDASGNLALRAGKYLADNIYIDTVLSAGGGLDVQLNFDITPNLTARGTVTSDGDTRLGIHFDKDY